MTDLDSKLSKAKIALMLVSPFISTICMGARHKITDKVSTAATNGINIYYNPQFIQDMSIPQLSGLIAHECWHIAFDHVSRRGTRDPIVWNYAGDYVINYMLRKAGLSLPDQGLYDTKYADWSTEQVYMDLCTDIEKQEEISKNFQLLDIQKNTIDDIQPDGSKSPVNTSSMEIKNLLCRAKTVAETNCIDTPESIPTEIRERIKDLLYPQVPWNEYLQRFLLQHTRDEYNWNRRNRRYSVYLPSMFNYGLTHLVFAVDTSSSVTDTEIRQYLSEIDYIKQHYKPERITIIDCSSQINNVYDVTESTEILDLKLTGRGGTSYIPVLDHLQDSPPQALVYFTDLYANLEIEPPAYPVLWICSSEHEPAPFGETVYIKQSEHAQ